MGLRAWLRKREAFIKKHKRKIIVAIIIIIILLSLFGTQLYLYANFMLGNDILVQMGTNTTSIELNNGQTADIEFDASVITNPFCSAECISEWKDISTGELLDVQTFVLRPGNPMEQVFTVQAKNYGHGQQLFQFSMTCTSKQTTFCHTAEEPTSRSSLISVLYSLSNEQNEAKERAKILLMDVEKRYDAYTSKWEITVKEYEALTAFTDVPELPQQFFTDFYVPEAAWYNHQFASVESELNTIEPQLAEAEEKLQTFRTELSALRTTWNLLVSEMQRLQTNLNITITSSSNAKKINQTVDDFHNIAKLLQEYSRMSTKESLVNAIVLQADTTLTEIQEEELEILFRLALERDMAADAICSLGGMCENHSSIAEQAQEKPDRETTCSRFQNATGTSTPEADAWLQKIENEYVLQIPNGTYAETLRKILTSKPESNVSNDTSIITILEQAVTPCVTYETKKTTLTLEPIHTLPIPNIIPKELKNPPSQCCVDDTCYVCCSNCSTENYPVVLLHGHAFNKDTLADFSLDAFRKLQQRLEKDGIISAGTVSLHTPLNREGEWGLIPSRISVRASYYFDVFIGKENYIVQTKSENIDTYAIRLEELVKTVKHKTGKDKVIIVTHSMGGLVTRRYIQIFGQEDVAGIVMIATPNAGIEGSVADYCPFIGERLECRDMNADSLFMNKLNRDPLPDIPVYNVYGSGCAMGQEDGDSVVTTNSAHIEGATNIIVKGTCKGLNTLHTSILDSDEYPEVYEAVKDIISLAS